MNSPIIEPGPATAGLHVEPDPVRRQRQRFNQALQDYLRASAVTRVGDAAQRARAHLLDEYLELAFLLHGGARCSLCGVNVRHPKAVTVYHRRGGRTRHDCLCVRCLVAETAVARHAVQRVGPVLYEYYAPVACPISWRGDRVHAA